MLVLSRDCDTVIRIGPDIKIKVLSIRKQRVKLGVDAPSNVRVWRDEIAPHPDVAAGPSDCDSPPPVVAESFPILVVEDNPEHALLISRILAQCQFPEVTVAPTGREAIELLSRRAANGSRGDLPRLVLLDLNLPDLSGLEVLRQIRAQRQLRMVPVVVLTAVEQDELVADCLEAGANAFVAKSTHYQKFRRSISRIATFWNNECRAPGCESRAVT